VCGGLQTRLERSVKYPKTFGQVLKFLITDIFIHRSKKLVNRGIDRIANGIRKGTNKKVQLISSTFPLVLPEKILLMWNFKN